MSFWAIVLISLIGAPMATMMVFMGAVFGAAAIANADHAKRANAVMAVALLACWLLLAAFGAFGVMPGWRALRGGGESFDGAAASFGHWLAGVAVVAAVYVVKWILEARARRELADDQPPSALLRLAGWAFVMGCWGMVIAWGVWPLVLWPIRGHFEWPDAATGWLHALEIAAGLLALAELETLVRKARAR